MYYCEKCGEHISDINKPCPTCGMFINRSINSLSNKADNKIFNIIIILIIVIGLGVGGVLFWASNSVGNSKINFDGENYSIYYDGDNWMESDLSNDEYYILQNKNDLNAFLQFPRSAVALDLNLDSGDARDELYASYNYILKNDDDYKYHNMTSRFMSLSDTNNYYITSDFYKYSDTSLKGKLFIVASSDGKVISILLKKGSKSLTEIEKDVYEVLQKIEM